MQATPHQHSPTETHRLKHWIAKWIGASWVWHAKLLSGTETSATQARRSGPCVPRDLLKPAFPSLADDVGATSVEFDIEIDSHGVREDQGPRRSAHRQRPLRCTTRRDAHHRFRHLVPAAGPREHRRAGDLRVSAGPRHRLSQVPDMDLPEPVETDVADDLIGPVEPGFPAPWGPA